MSNDKNKKHKKNKGKNSNYKPRHIDAYKNRVVSTEEILNDIAPNKTQDIQFLNQTEEQKAAIADLVVNTISLKQGSLHVAAVPLDILYVDASYQRVEAYDLLNLVKTWDIDKAGSITLSYRDGKLYIIDGLHRVSSGILKGETKLIAFIHTTLTKQDEARLFRSQNKGKSTIKPIQDYKAGLTAEDIDCVTLANILDEFELKVSTSSGHYTLTSIRSALNIITNHDNNGDCLRWIIKLMHDTKWTYHGKNAMNAQYLNNLARIYDMSVKTGTLDIARERLFSVFTNVDPCLFGAYSQLHYTSNDKRGFTGKCIEDIVNGKVSVTDFPIKK